MYCNAKAKAHKTQNADLLLVYLAQGPGIEGDSKNSSWSAASGQHVTPWQVFTHIWSMFMVNVGKYAIHGSWG